MPKLKTRRGAAKRFKLTAGGKFLRRKAYKSHLLTHKRRKVKRRLKRSAVVDKGGSRHLKLLLRAGL
jgi:large subunit ribosomal protein L35